MRHHARQLMLGSLLAGCTQDEGGHAMEIIPECGYSETTTDVPSDTVLGLQELVGYLADLYPTPARWWDGAETELFVELDTAAVPALVAQTTYAYDPATSGADASEDGCGTFNYWAIPFPVLAAGTSDGLLNAAVTEVEIVCGDNVANRPPPEDDLPNNTCRVRAEFALPVDVDPSRVPPGDSAPFSARVTADAPHEGAIIAQVSGSAGPGAAGEGAGDTTSADSVLSTLTN